jgi:hypothetical protein
MHCIAQAITKTHLKTPAAITAAGFLVAVFMLDFYPKCSFLFILD